jgi:anti-sigma regulatory factor (Ser/Thr protein kinase)
MDRVAEVAKSLLTPADLERLKTAVAETTMNAIEHGNHNNPDLPVEISVASNPSEVRIRITDNGGGAPIPDAPTPDIDAKLSGEQTPRGWGLFLIKNMVDEMNITSDEHNHTIELVLLREEGSGETVRRPGAEVPQVRRTENAERNPFEEGNKKEGS